MHKDLKKLLGDVWKDKKGIMDKASNYSREDFNPEGNDAIWDIYARYNSSVEASCPVPAKTWLPCLRELATLEDVIQIAPEIQSADWINLYIGGMADIYVSAATANATAPNLRGKLEQLAWEQGIVVASAFLHYRRHKRPCRERIYLNTKRETRATVFATLLAETFTGKGRVDGISNAKLAGPIDSNRADSILFYLEDGDDVQAVLDAISKFQKGRGGAGCFHSSVPKLTTPVKGLKGVSRAQEPPSYYIYFDREKKTWRGYQLNQSFGFYRSCLIFEALKESHESKDKADFFKNAEAFFRAGGIDPDKPSLQGPTVFD